MLLHAGRPVLPMHLLAGPGARVIYLASPYTHADPAVMQERFEQACRAAGALMNMGHVTFSPIAHTHPIAQFCELPVEWEFWRRQDFELLDHASKLVVLMLPGWQESRGVAAERERAEYLRIPVLLRDFGTLSLI